MMKSLRYYDTTTTTTNNNNTIIMNSVAPRTKHHHHHHHYLLLFQIMSSFVLFVVLFLYYYLTSLWSYNNNNNKYFVTVPPAATNTSKQIQISHATSMNRYVQEYTAAKDYFDSSSSKSATTTTTAATAESISRILSFGSSTGEEAITLATMYFNETRHSEMKIIGIDIDEPTLKKAEDNVRRHRPPIVPESKISFYNGRDSLLNNSYIIEKGKYYDIIFDNSVLCYHRGMNTTLDEIVTHFPFSDYESTLLALDESLKVGGILAIVNMNYNFEDSQLLASRYKVVSTCNGNFVPRVVLNKGNNMLITPNRLDQMDCLWVKMRNA